MNLVQTEIKAMTLYSSQVLATVNETRNDRIFHQTDVEVGNARKPFSSV